MLEVGIPDCPNRIHVEDMLTDSRLRELVRAGGRSLCLCILPVGEQAGLTQFGQDCQGLAELGLAGLAGLATGHWSQRDGHWKTAAGWIPAAWGGC